MNKRKRLARVVCAVLVCLMLISLVAPLYWYAMADDDSSSAASSEASSGSSSSSSSVSTGSQLVQELAAIRDKIAAVQKDIAAAEDAKQDAAEIRTMYQQKADLLDQEITAMQADIAEQETNLENMQKVLADKVLELQATKDLFGERLAAMYIRGSSSDLEVLLGADSFADMLRSADDLQQIAICDTDLIERLRQQRDDFQRQADDIQTALDDLNAQKADLDSKMAEYENAIAKANNDIAAAEQEKTDAQQTAEELSAQYKQKEAEWASWASSSGVTNTEYTGGPYIWPLPGYTRLSSAWGAGRYIYGVWNVHRGIDIPAPAGTPIYAAASGMVSTNNHWSYGISVKVSVTTSTVNIYGHMTSRAAGITDGVYVYAGQLIGYVGSTGNSTGNHLHFEVDINGSPVSPMPYFGA